jgi:hypothetical protein
LSGFELRMERGGEMAAQRRPCTGRRSVRGESLERIARTCEGRSTEGTGADEAGGLARR